MALCALCRVQIQLVQPGQIQLQGGQTLQLQGQQGQPQQIIIQQPQTAITAGQTQVLNPFQSSPNLSTKSVGDFFFLQNVILSCRGSRLACRASRWHRLLMDKRSSISPSTQTELCCSRVSKPLLPPPVFAFCLLGSTSSSCWTLWLCFHSRAMLTICSQE